MKINRLFVISVYIVFAEVLLWSAPMFAVARTAKSISVKLPYAAGEWFIVTQGYHTPPTHIKKDAYALDFTQDGCGAYGKSVVAAAAGKVMFMSQKGYNGGYGTEIILDHSGNIVSRYAHMIPGSITVKAGVAVSQGEPIGRIGNTGLVAGRACIIHPGTHIHFAMDIVEPNGAFAAYDPEPISGYANMTAGRWYLSNNREKRAISAVISTPGKVLGASIGAGAETAAATATIAVATTTATIPNAPTSSLPSISTQCAPSVSTSSIINVYPVGGVSAIAPVSTLSPGVQKNNGSSGSNDSKHATSTGQSNATSTSGSSSSGTIGIAATNTVLFEQVDSSTEFVPSWYSDNWYDLGNGFSGMLNSLTLKGKTNGTRYVTSQQFSLQEFRDASYTAMIDAFPLTGPWFVPTMTSTTFNNLLIPLKPYFYYRLTTSESLQNGSVILAGTPTTTDGVGMYDKFIYGTGRVEYTEPFFPFMIMRGKAATSTLLPPPLTPPTNLSVRFDELGMAINLSFGSSTDPDWPNNPLHYEMNYSTSTTLFDDGWISPKPISVATGNAYRIGVRAKDNFGDISAAATTSWSFPSGFTPYVLSPRLSSASQYFKVSASSTLRSIELFTKDFSTGARNPRAAGCSLTLIDQRGGTTTSVSVAAENGFSGYSCAGDLEFSFASASPALYPGHSYHWILSLSTGNPSTGAGVRFYGTASDTAGGAFSNPALANAKFKLIGLNGIIFSN